MAMCGMTCPCCKRSVAWYRKSGKMYPHMPYDRKSNTDLLSRGRRCLGSGKTGPEAEQAAEDRAARIRAFFAAESARRA